MRLNLVKEFKTNKIDYLLLVLFLVVGWLVRVDGLFTGDFPFLFDHGRDMLAVKKIVVDNKLTLIGPHTGFQGLFHGPIWYYLLAIPFFFSGGDPVASVLLMVVLGILSIILGYFVGRSLFSRATGLLLALFIAFSPSSVFLSRFFWNPYPIPSLMLVFYFFVLKIVRDKKANVFLWGLSGFVAGMIGQFNLAFGFFMIPATALLILIFGIRKLESFVAALFGCLITFLSQVLFESRHDFLMTRSLIKFFAGESRGLGEVVIFPTRFFHRLNELERSTILSISQDKFLAYCIFFLAVFIFVFLSRRKEKKEKLISNFIALAILPSIMFLGFLIFPYVAWSYYWIGLQTTYYLFLAVVFGTLLQLEESKFFQLVVISVLIIWGTYTLVSPSLYVAKGEGGPTTYKNEINAIDWIYQDAGGEPFGLFVYTPPVYDYAYQYLFWWRGSKKYGYLPTQDKGGLFYLIIEPDPERPWGPQGWKETVIKTGRVVKEVTLPGRITIEKRHGEG